MRSFRERPSLFRSSLLGLLLLCASPTMARAQDDAETDPYLEDVRAAERAILKGKYAKARTFFEEILEAYEEVEEGEAAEEDRPTAAVMLATRQGLIELALIRGEYESALRLRGALSKTEQAAPRTALLSVRAWRSVGQYEKAETELRRLVDGKLGGYEARYWLGHVLALIGRVKAAEKVYEAGIGAADRQSVRDPMDIYYLARMHMTLSGRDHFQTAASLLVEASRKAEERLEARTALGELYFLAYRESKKGPSAESQVKKVLAQNPRYEPALLVMYQSRSFNMFLDAAKTAGYLQKVLALNPNSVPALVMRARRLIDDRLFAEGALVLDQALKINPRDRHALAHRAAAANLMHKAEDEKAFRARARKGIEGGYADLDRVMGDHLVALYRFAASRPFFKAALKIDPEYVPAMHGLAKANVYTGRGKAAAELLAKAKALEPGFADSWRENILLSESRLAEEYDVVERGDFIYVIHKADRAVVEDYLVHWYQEAHDVLGRKYGYMPKAKVRVELLHEWVDFSVRTIGFRGFSALGACFGEFITMVSPSDDLLRRNDFMWSATAWHEYAHVLTLALSKNRVPRWLTEGLSVHEEGAKNRTWERGMLRDLLDAYHNKDLPPLRLLNRLFRGSRILFGYYQGGLVVEYLSEKHGFAKVLEMLKGYGEDMASEKLFHRTFGYSTREFDTHFRRWVVQKKLRGLRIVPRLNPKGLRAAKARVQDSDDPKVKVEARLAIAWHHLRRVNRRGRRVGLVEAGIELGAILRIDAKHPMATLAHAELLGVRKKTDEAIAKFEKGFAAKADGFLSRLFYAGLLEKEGRPGDALVQYQAAKACWPQCSDQALSPQLRIAAMLKKQGKLTEAMMEVKSFCRLTARAFNPRMELAAYEKSLGNHKAEAEYLEQAVQIDPFMRSLHDRLGDAYIKLGKIDAARREFKVGLAVQTEMDRAYLNLQRGQQKPSTDSPEEALARGKLCVKIARTSWKLGDKKQAAAFLDRAEAEAPESDVTDEVHELRSKWKF